MDKTRDAFMFIKFMEAIGLVQKKHFDYMMYHVEAITENHPDCISCLGFNIYWELW